MIYIDDEFMTVSENDRILTLAWKDGTKEFTDETFKQEALTFIGVVKSQNSKLIIVDMRKFDYELGTEIIGWRNENIVTVYNEIGVEKFAFISTKPTVKQDNPENTFVTKSFVNEEDAIRRLQE